MRYLAALTFLLAQPAGWKPPAVRIQDEGELQGYVSTLNCVGAGISCSVGASVATLSVSGGGAGGGSPGGTSGNVQINSAGGFGAYTGTTCSYAVKSLDANGAATCTAAPTLPFPAGSASELQVRANGTAFGAYTGTGACAAGSYMTALDAFGAKTCGTPTIPADISSAHYVTTQAEAGLSAEAVLPTCAGTDKLTFDGVTISCAADQTGAGGGAPTTATYITQTPDATLSAEQALSTLGTGLLKNTTGTGVLSVAVAGADYQAPLTLPLSIANGGTGAALTAVNGGIVYSTATAHAHSAAGTVGQALFSGGAGAPTWGDGDRLVRLTADYTNSTTTMSNTALTWTSPAAISRSGFECVLMTKASTTTTGEQFDINVSTTPTTITYELEYVTAAGTAPSTGGTKVFVQATAAATAIGPASTSLTTYTLWRLRGIIVHTSTSATMTVRGKVGASGTITVGSGSNCKYYSL